MRRATFRVFSVRCRHTRSPQSGRAHDFFVLEAPDRGNVVPVTPGGNLACVRQYRPGTEAVTLEIPAGCTAREVIPLGAGDPQPCDSEQRLPPVSGRRRVPGVHPGARRGEELEVERVALSERGRLVRDGRVQHALVVVAFHLLDQYVETHPEALSQRGEAPFGTQA